MKLLRNLVFLCFVAVLGYGFGTASNSEISPLNASPNVPPSQQVEGIASSSAKLSTPPAVIIDAKTASPSPTLKPTPKPTIKPNVKPTVKPTFTPLPSSQSDGLSNDNYYINSAPAGATAICRDGTYSFSESRRGTCSHHNGVSQWL